MAKSDAQVAQRQRDLQDQIRDLALRMRGWQTIAQMLIAKAHGLTEEQAAMFTLPPLELYELDSTTGGYKALAVEETLTKWVLSLADTPLRQRLHAIVALGRLRARETPGYVEMVPHTVIADILDATMPPYRNPTK